LNNLRRRRKIKNLSNKNRIFLNLVYALEYQNNEGLVSNNNFFSLSLLSPSIYISQENKKIKVTKKSWSTLLKSPLKKKVYTASNFLCLYNF